MTKTPTEMGDLSKYNIVLDNLKSHLLISR